MINNTVKIDTTDNMGDKQMTVDEVMNFMKKFQENIERTMNGIGKDINTKIEDKLSNLDKGLANLADEVRKNDTDQRDNIKNLEDKLERRLRKLEIDTDRN